ADDRLAAVHRVDEGLVQPVGLRSGPRADEHLGSDVERQLLGSGVELKPGARLPLREAVRDGWVDRIEIRDEALALGRLLHDPAVVAVLLEVHEHHCTTASRPGSTWPWSTPTTSRRTGRSPRRSASSRTTWS